MANHLPHATARATSNIAFVKYWGRIDDKLRLPMNSSVSMNLASTYTTTTVEFDETLNEDEVNLEGETLNSKQTLRVSQHLDRIRNLAGITTFARIDSNNNFPMGAGIASSASAFAALTVAGCKAAGLELSEKELTILARQGSGSACRSVPSGFVEWHFGETNEASFAEQIAPPEHWDVRDFVAITQTEHKEVGSAEGNRLVSTSPFNDKRIDLAQQSVKTMRRAILDRDWTSFGEETEREAVRLHMIAMTSQPPIFYWSPVTLRIIQAVMNWRKAGLEAYYTIDAGANVHVLALGDDAAQVTAKIQAIEGVTRVIHNKAGTGTTILG